MPEIVHWLSANPVRWVIPALLLLAVVGAPVTLWWEKRRPSVPGWVAEKKAWESLSTAEQAAVDAEALAMGAAADAADRAALTGAQDAARLAVERMAAVNVQYHP